MKQYTIRLALLLLLPAALLCFRKKDRKITIYSIGDSTMCDFDQKYLSSFGGEGYPIRGWMQMAPQFFTDDVTIHNEALSGRSSKSFRDEGHWKKVIGQVKAGDYVFIMFGGNDQKPDSARHTEPHTSFRQNFINYIDEVKAKGAYPVLFTSIVRRKFDKNGQLVDTYGDYVTVVRELAAEQKLPFVDLYRKTWDLVQGLGPENSKKLFLYIEPGRFTKLPDGKKDDSHLNIEGATRVAELAAKGLKDLGIPLSQYIR
ncbi:MAG: rhamnogalacturonan acetylesterase [Bacteroidetes bacterium]|nr:rhamnogalacturonan acetylesterase [Bacteroidota bacterium]